MLRATHDAMLVGIGTILADDPLLNCRLTRDELYEAIINGHDVSIDNTLEVHQPDIIILDLMLPEIDGLEVAKTIRKTSSVPIIMLSAKDSEFDKVIGLELGADDYVTKPFSIVSCRRVSKLFSVARTWFL